MDSQQQVVPQAEPPVYNTNPHDYQNIDQQDQSYNNSGTAEAGPLDAVRNLYPAELSLPGAMTVNNHTSGSSDTTLHNQHHGHSTEMFPSSTQDSATPLHSTFPPQPHSLNVQQYHNHAQAPNLPPAGTWVSQSTELERPLNPIQTNLAYCRYCKIYKPVRSHHCRVCGVCTLGME